MNKWQIPEAELRTKCRSSSKLCKTQREKSFQSLQAKVDFISAIVIKWTYDALGMKAHRKKAGGRLAKTELLVNGITQTCWEWRHYYSRRAFTLPYATWEGSVVSSRRKESNHLHDNAVGAQEWRISEGATFEMALIILGSAFQWVHLKRCHSPIEDTNCCYILRDWYFKTQTQISFKY